MRSTFLLLFFVAALVKQVQAQPAPVYQNFVGSVNLKSVLLHTKGVELSPPYLQLGSAVPLELHFDDLGNQIRDFQYTLLHCNANWTQSNLLPQEYLDGFTEDYLSDYAFSFNTLQAYVHYKLEIPNRNVSIKKSGNYIIKVYEPGKSETPILQLRFLVYESAASITSIVKRSDVVRERDNLQEIDFKVGTSFPILSPFTEIKAAILQNFRWEDAIENMAPTFARENELVFDFDLKSSFPASNEYRYLDIKSLRFKSERTANIITTDALYAVDVVRDVPRAKLPYATYQDINGKYIIRNDDGPNNPLTDADYAWVTFTLPYQTPINYGVIYLNGSFTLGRMVDEYKMIYNYDIGAYQCKVLMKQGYYNYQYILQMDKQKPSNAFAEGNFFQTENDYTIVIYYKDFSSDYDRIIALNIANSVRSNQ